jgi:protein O-GlcNAc transferase
VLVLVDSGCSPAKTAPGKATLRPVSVPELSRMEPPVQAQMREAYASLMKKIDAKTTPAAEMAAAYGAMGNLLLAAEYLDAAEPCYLNAQALAQSDMRWPYYLGHVYRTRGEPEKAAEAFERALELAPSDLATLVWLGNVHLDQGKADEAERLFTRALSQQPRSVAALAGQGRAALASRQFARAVESFEQALSVDSRASMVHYPLALAYRGLGDMAKAEAHAKVRGEIEVGPSDPLMQELAGVLHSAVSYEKQGIRALDAGDWAMAASWFRKAIDLAPDNASLHHRLGTALSLTGDTRGAVEQFRDALRLSPQDAPSHFSLGVLLGSSGRDAEAVERFAAAVRYEPAYAEARLQLAGTLIRLRRFDEARAQLIEGTKRNPERPEFSRALEQFRPRAAGRQ